MPVDLSFLAFQVDINIVNDLFEGTRFDGIGNGVGGIGSIASRLDIFSGFWAQFDIDPILGNYDSHVLSFSGSGNYVHSVLLSLLSHGGLFAFLLFAIIFIRVLMRQGLSMRFGIWHLRFRFWLLLGMLGLGSLVAFFTWPPLWFLIGLCITTPDMRFAEPDIKLLN